MAGNDMKRRRRSESATADTGVHISARPATGAEGPAAVISRRAADRLRAGHVWVYRSDVVEVPDNAPYLIPVVDQRGILLGSALYSSVSEIALRVISTELVAGHSEWLELLGTRLRKAIAQRSGILASADTNACRLVFSEADALPGIIVDKYGELIIVQLLTRALDNEAVRIVVTNVLRETLDPATLQYRAKGGDEGIRKVTKGIAKLEDPAERIRKLVEDPGKAGQFAWRVLSRVLAYSARRIGEITDSNGRTFYSSLDIFIGPFNPIPQTDYLVAVGPLSGGIWAAYAFGADTSLTVEPGWDNVTGYGTPNGLPFIKAVGTKNQ